MTSAPMLSKGITGKEPRLGGKLFERNIDAISESINDLICATQTYCVFKLREINYGEPYNWQCFGNFDFNPDINMRFLKDLSFDENIGAILFSEVRWISQTEDDETRESFEPTLVIEYYSSFSARLVQRCPIFPGVIFRIERDSVEIINNRMPSRHLPNSQFFELQRAIESAQIRREQSIRAIFERSIGDFERGVWMIRKTP